MPSRATRTARVEYGSGSGSFLGGGVSSSGGRQLSYGATPRLRRPVARPPVTVAVSEKDTWSDALTAPEKTVATAESLKVGVSVTDRMSVLSAFARSLVLTESVALRWIETS